MCLHHFQRWPGERRLAREHLIQHNAKRILVGRGGDVLGLTLLGAHVRRGSDRGADLRETRLARNLGDAEVRDNRVALVIQQDVGGLDVAMHHPPAVRITQGAGNLGEPHLHYGDRQWPVLPDHGLERRAGHILHHKVLELVGFFDGVDRDDVRMIEGSHRDRFAMEALDHARGEHEAWRHDLDRDTPVELDLAREKHSGHAAEAEGAADFVLVAGDTAKVLEDAVPRRTGRLFHERRAERLLLRGSAMRAEAITGKKTAATLRARGLGCGHGRMFWQAIMHRNRGLRK